jgi:hypothetical protein
MVAEARYDFGDVRVATLALLTLTALSGLRSRGVVIAKFPAIQSLCHFAKFADDLCRQINICVTPMSTWRP